MGMTRPAMDFHISWFLLVGGSFVCAAWVWFAVRTQHCLRIITRGAMPYSSRTIWLLKILAIIVGAGNVAGLIIAAGAPWALAVIPSAIVVLVALGEKVTGIVVTRPPQTAFAYRSAWAEYRRLRARAARAALVVPALFAAIVLISLAGQRLPEKIERVVWAGFAIAFVASFFALSYHNYQLQRWRCPRCGRFFRGFWRWPLPTKQCAYCGLPRWTEAQSDSQQPKY